MPRRTRGRRCRQLAVAAVTGALITAIGASTAQAASCKRKDLCLVKTNGLVVVVGSHKSKKFKPPIGVVETINNESVGLYCDELQEGSGYRLFVIPPGTEKVAETIVQVFPGPICPCCATPSVAPRVEHVDDVGPLVAMLSPGGRRETFAS